MRHYHNLAQANNKTLEAVSALSLQERYLLTQGIEIVVVYQETDQITTIPTALHQAVLRAHTTTEARRGGSQ